MKRPETKKNKVKLLKNHLSLSQDNNLTRRIFLIRSTLTASSVGFLSTAGRLEAQGVTSGPVTGEFPVSIRVDAARPIGKLRPIWRFFGADEPNYAQRLVC